MEIAGYIASLLIGVSLGLIGGGGSILTVPTMVYLFGVDAVVATVYSLLVVGTTSAVGSLSYFRKGLVHTRTALVFGIPSLFAVFLTRSYVLPAIPFTIMNIGDFTVTKSIVLLLLFAILMILASYSMIKKRATQSMEMNTQRQNTYLMILIQGIAVGIVTGFVGAGGGFLIIPVLVNVVRLEMKQAIGTSLFIISLNSLFGFALTARHDTINWTFLIKILALSIIGVVVGSFLSKFINGNKLKRGFGWFVLVMGVYIILKETVFK
ncbi:MAG: sulfite exporter TauE/SafE family protein [Candidatus Kapabacteria bacterium]|nr:sulfite exporter TauE/SafE family protein [Candidatus Kapabacteria bacterium]